MATPYQVTVGIKLRQRVAHQMLSAIDFALRSPAASAGPAFWQHEVVGKAAAQRDWSRAAKDTRLQQPYTLNPKRRVPRPKKLPLGTKNMVLACMLCSASRRRYAYHWVHPTLRYCHRKRCASCHKAMRQRACIAAAGHCRRPAAVVSVEARRRAGRTTAAVWRAT